MTLSHAQVWAAIDALASSHRLSASGLARKAGLDATTFNPSKRVSGDGRERWPSTESLAKVMEATGTSLEQFVALVEGNYVLPRQRALPLIGFAQAGAGGFFDDGGFPTGSGWDEINFPVTTQGPVYALEITGDSMLPLYRDGDRIIVAPGEQVRRGDRVVVKTTDGEIMAKILRRRTAKAVELASLNPSHPVRIIDTKDIDWIARILWASQ